jgi:energy-converting hydrogenase B subunit D
MFEILNLLLVIGLIGTALLTVRVKGVLNAIVAFSAMGTFLALLFLLLQAPDVALSEAAVGAVATPMVFLIALAKIRGLLDDPHEAE